MKRIPGPCVWCGRITEYGCWLNAWYDQPWHDLRWAEDIDGNAPPAIWSCGGAECYDRTCQIVKWLFLGKLGTDFSLKEAIELIRAGTLDLS